MKNYSKINGKPVVNVAKCTTAFGNIEPAKLVLFYTALQLQSLSCQALLPHVRQQAKVKTKRIKAAADRYLESVGMRAAKAGEGTGYEDSECDIIFRCLLTQKMVLQTMQVPSEMLEYFYDKMEGVVKDTIRRHEKNERYKK